MKEITVNSSQLSFLIKEELFGVDKSQLSEGLSATDKSEIGTIVKSEIKNFFKLNRSVDFEKEIEKIVNDTLSKTKTKDEIAEIAKNVIVQLYKALWMKRNFWKTELKNLPS